MPDTIQLKPSKLDKSKRAGWTHVVGKLAPYGMVVLLAFELAMFSYLAPNTFATTASMNVVASSSAILGLITIALLVPLIAGEIDASLPAVLTVTSLTAASLMSQFSWPLVAAVAASVLLATLIGFINGFLVVRFKVPSLITTLGTFTILIAVITGLAGGRVIEDGLPADTLAMLSEPKPLGIPLPLIYLAVTAFVVWYITEQTPIGRQWKAVGSSTSSAHMVGIQTGRVQLAFSI
jgi:ribose transport system permease protein